MVDRWDEVNVDSVVWNNVYLELENLARYSYVVTILNGRLWVLPIGRERLHEFIRIFPTVLWVTLLQSCRQQNSAYRILIAANDIGFVDRALGYLTRSDKSSMKSRKEYLTMIQPIRLTNGWV